MARIRYVSRLKFVAKIVLVYLALGVVYGMVGEIRTVATRSDNTLSALRDPDAYKRSAMASPIWAYEMFRSVAQCADPFGCAVQN